MRVEFGNAIAWAKETLRHELRTTIELDIDGAETLA
jgi:hypothetical protein